MADLKTAEQVAAHSLAENLIIEALGKYVSDPSIQALDWEEAATIAIQALREGADRGEAVRDMMKMTRDSGLQAKFVL